MNAHNRYLWLAVLTVSTSLLWALPAQAARMRWCTTWTVEYVDAGLGEDYLESPVRAEAPARYARALVTEAIDNRLVWSGRLDLFGCTPLMQVQSHMVYRFAQATLIESDDGFRVFLEPEGYDWGSTFTWLSSYYRTAELPEVGSFTHVFRPSWHSAQSNMAPVAALAMSQSHLAYPADTDLYVRSDEAACEISAYLHDQKVCVRSDYWGEDHSAWKFVVAHELGHFNADPLDGPVTVSYNAFGAPRMCGCSHVDTHFGEAVHIGLHCLQSREFIGTAAAEGWAHTLAAATFNDRDEGDCTFVYYKRVRVAEGDDGVVDPPFPVDCNAPPQWMETHCDPGDQHLGVEWDWLSFYWGLFAPSDPTLHRLRFELAELAYIWSETPELDSLRDLAAIGQPWDELLLTVRDIYGPLGEKAWFFGLMGFVTGVDHAE